MHVFQVEAQRFRGVKRLPEVTQLVAEGQPGPAPVLFTFVPRDVAQIWLEGCFVWPHTAIKKFI